MNAYDFDDTIYDGDSSMDFFKFYFKKHPSLLKYVPAIIKIYSDYKKTNLRFEDVIANYGGILKAHVLEKKPDPEALAKEFWDKHEHKIKPFYREIQRPDDLLITASPEFQIKEICSRIGIKNYLATELDMVTGEFGRACFREKKIDFLLEAYPDAQIDDFYTDSLNDEFLFPYAKRVFMVKGHKITRIK